MADRYVKLDCVISIIKDVNWNLGGLIQHLKEHCPTADVVPKSEVEALEREIERLKKSMLPSYYSACSEEEAIKIGKQYGRNEVAREIFEEIESTIRKHDERPKYQLILDFAELKKKYTEGDVKL